MNFASNGGGGTLITAGTGSTSGHNAVNDFSITNGNPNGVWSYLAGGTLLSTTESGENGISGLDRWYNGQTQVPDIAAVIKNTTGSSITLSGTDQIPPDHLNLDPQGISNIAVQFTASASGTYVITGNFLGDDTGEHAHPVQVLDNGTAVFSGTISSFDQVAPFGLVETLNAGDTITFAVDTGPNGVFANQHRPRRHGQFGNHRCTRRDLDIGSTSADAIAFAGGTGTLVLGNPSTFTARLLASPGRQPTRPVRT